MDTAMKTIITVEKDITKIKCYGIRVKATGNLLGTRVVIYGTYDDWEFFECRSGSIDVGNMWFVSTLWQAQQMLRNSSRFDENTCEVVEITMSIRAVEDSEAHIDCAEASCPCADCLDDGHVFDDGPDAESKN